MNIYRKNYIDYWKQFNPLYEIPKGFHVHHIKPQSCGGSDYCPNLIALHPDDHLAIHKNRGDKVANSPWIIKGGHTVPHTEETKEKIRKARVKQDMSYRKGKQIGSVGLKGDENISKRPEVRKKIKEKFNLRPKLTCPHCGKTGQYTVMHRWHFDNCKKLY